VAKSLHAPDAIRLHEAKMHDQARTVPNDNTALPDRLIIQSPSSGETLGEAPVMTPDEVRATVARAHQAQVAWGALAVRERCAALSAFRKKIAQNADVLAHAVSSENGKPLQEALTHDILPFCDLMAYFESRAPKILAPQAIHLHFMMQRRSYLHCVPRGVIGVIGPWNFPFSIPIGDAVMALFAGNAAVIKPSEVTPLIAQKAKALWDEACRDDPRLTPDLLQIVTGRGQTGATLCTSGVEQVMFTGSVPTGKKVAVACAERLIPCVLELGGINPAIVTADADVERTAHAILWGAFANSGQVCASVSRVYVEKPIADKLTQRVVELTKTLQQGDPLNPDTELGAMTFMPQIAIGQGILDDTIAQGGRVLCGGTPNGRFFPPTVLDNVQHGWKITREESFSPLLAFVTVDDVDTAIRFANDSDKGLMAYVFAGDEERGARIAEQLEAGTTMVNNAIDSHGAPGTPWQGVKESGIGQVHSAQGLRDLCQVRHVQTRSWLPWMQKELWWYPYSPKVYGQFLKLVSFMWGGGPLDGFMRKIGK
jgi:acyl-CoA reductase-like NAD-dependent aldehyde dehydrogenase